MRSSRIEVLLLLTGALLAPSPGRAEERPPVVAVFEIQNATKEVSKTLAAALTDQLRVRLASTKRVVVIDKTEQEAALKRVLEEQRSDSYKACVDDACQIPLGKELAANRILRSKLTRFGKTFVLSAEMTDLATGGSAGGASVECDGSEDALLGAVGELTTQLTGAAPVRSGQTSGALATIPALTGALAGGSVVNLDVDANLLVAYDAALRAEQTGADDPELARKSWDAVAKIGGKNPYKKDAAKRAKEWGTFAEKKRALAAQRDKDLDSLRKILPLGSLPEQTKRELLERYTGSYGQSGLASLLALAPQGGLRTLMCDMLVGSTDFPETTVAINGSASFEIPKHTTLLRIAGRTISGPKVRLPPCTLKAEITSSLGHELAFDLEPLAAGEYVSIHLSRIIPVDDKGCASATSGGVCRDLETGLELLRLGQHSQETAADACARLAGGWHLPSITEAGYLAGAGYSWHFSREDGEVPSSPVTGARFRNGYHVYVGHEWGMRTGVIYTSGSCGGATRSIHNLSPKSSTLDDNTCVPSAEVICVRGGR